MADLARALDEALTERYPPVGPKRPATHRQGLTARMNALEKLFPSKRKGSAGRAAAKAAGIAPDTWTRWKNNKQRKPTAASLRKLEEAFDRLVRLPGMRKRFKAVAVPNRVKVTATIRWSSSPGKNYNKQAHRTTTLESMRPVMRAVIRAWVHHGPEVAAHTFEDGTAELYRTDEVRFEGDRVTVEFLEDEH